MKRLNLAEALLLIAANNFVKPEHITAISFEDGSGLCFNYSMNSGKFFARFSHIDPSLNCSEKFNISRNTFRSVS